MSSENIDKYIEDNIYPILNNPSQKVEMISLGEVEDILIEKGYLIPGQSFNDLKNKEYYG